MHSFQGRKNIGTHEQRIEGVEDPTRLELPLFSRAYGAVPTPKITKQVATDRIYCRKYTTTVKST